LKKIFEYIDIMSPHENIEILVDKSKPTIALYREKPVYQFVLYPENESVDDKRSKFARLTAGCLIEQLRSRSNRTKPQSLIGECNKNAIQLGKYLRQNNIICDVYLGYNENAGVAENIQEAYDKQIIHWWIESDGYTLEVCSECTGCIGRMYVSRERPSNYSKLQVVGIETFESKDYPYPRIENLGHILPNQDISSSF